MYPWVYMHAGHGAYTSPGRNSRSLILIYPEPQRMDQPATQAARDGPRYTVNDYGLRKLKWWSADP